MTALLRLPQMQRRLRLATLVVLSLVAFTALLHDAGAAGRVVVTKRSFNCSGPVDIDLLKVTITEGTPGNDNALNISPGCTGRIGRVELETNQQDGIKVHIAEGEANDAHDLVIEDGYIYCPSAPPRIHQDGIQAMDGQRLTFRSLVINCPGNTNFPGTRVGNAQVFVNQGSATAMPTDVVVEDSYLVGYGPSGVRINASLRSGVRDSVVCQPFYSRLGVVLVGGQREPITNGIDIVPRSTPYCSWRPGDPEPGTSPGTVQAGLAAVDVRRAASGKRSVIARVATTETVSIQLRVVRKGRTLARITRRDVRAGTRTVRAAVPAKIAKGGATARVKVTDGDGNTRTFTQKIRLPAGS